MTRRAARRAANRARSAASTPEVGEADTAGEITAPEQDSPAPVTEASAIRVEVDAAVGGWPTHARFDIVLRGQIISTSPIDSFSIREPAGLEVATVEFGHADAQEAATASGSSSEFRVGFQVYVPMPGGDAIRIADMWVTARSRDGAVFETGMRLGCMSGQAAILAGPVRDLPANEMPPPRGIVYLESAVLTDDGQLLVHGWAVATSMIVAIQIFVDGARIGAAVHGRERADVADAYPGYANSRRAGFALRKSLGDAMRRGANVTAQVLCLSGASLMTTIPLANSAEVRTEELLADFSASELGTLPPPGDSTKVASAPPRSAARDVAERGPEGPRGIPDALEQAESASRAGGADVNVDRIILIVCDRAIVGGTGDLLVEGWAACGQGIERIAIHVDGRPAGDADYGRERLDVAAEYPGMPVHTGFVFELVIPDLAGGPRKIHIVVSNRAGDRKELVVDLVPTSAPRFLFELDNPKTRDGVMIQPITGRLVIEGWALARDGMAGIEVDLDGTTLGQAHYGMARPDVGAAFPDWEGSVRSGYNFHCPSRALPDGDHVIRITARSKTGATHVHSFRVSVRKTDDPEEAASIRRRIKRVEINTVAAVLDQLDWRPSFHVIVTGSHMPDTGADETARALTIRSIVEQSWADWRVTIFAPGEPEAETARALIDRLAHGQAWRFAVIDPSRTEAWTAPLGGETEASLTVLIASGDELGRDALAAFAMASGLHPNADCFYADEFRVAPGGSRPEAFFKPDFSPALLLSMNYIGRPIVSRSGLLAATAVSAESLSRDGFHDLALRCTEAAAMTYHVPELLSRTDGGTAATPDDAAAAPTRAMERRGIEAKVSPGLVPETWHVRRTTPAPGKVSIIVPTCAAKGYVETCLKTLRAMTAYKNFEIVCIDNIPDAEIYWKDLVREHADKVVELPPPFNWSHFNNTAAAAADGEYLLFLNDDIEIIQPDWLDAMLEAAAWPEVGIVGARLLYPNRTVQHAGMFLGDGMGRHAFRHLEETDPGYFGLALTRREVIAVTGACLLVRRDIFEELGRFDEAHDVVNNDLDFCLRAHRAGLRTIYTPHATLIHHELASRDHLTDDFDRTRFTGEWRALFAAGDPYFNPRLSRYSDDYRVDDEGVRAMYAGHPLIERASVKAILVVKVDHIGDFITSLPAIRRLKAAFPDARLTALVAPASASIGSIEPAIDECIPFEFFHARSELGEKELTEAELGALTERLAPYRFDIAVDLRKHLSTRHLLLCAGAKLLAGFDSLDAFPWLDVVLEWDGDKALQRKRSHIVDDLVNLAAAIDAACDPDRRLFHPAPSPLTAEELPDAIRDLFARPVVAIHPGSGNVMRQWPEKHIPPLIDLLIQRNDVSVLLVGGPDDEAKAASIVDQIGRPDRVRSIAGQMPLRSLPRLLAACALFIGGNSGPKHIAAASGVPTIGIHSGVVDPGEWGPIGERSVALYRDMSCAPCFLAKPEHCPRGLACVDMLDPALVHQMARMFLARPESHRLATRRPIMPTTQPTDERETQPRKRVRRIHVAQPE